ncbi:MAG: aminoacyl-tRNA deacylase [bacterium]
MSMATGLRNYLDTTHLPYDVVHHKHAESSQRRASAAHLPGGQFAKSVLLKDDQGYVLAVLPANRRVHLGKLHKRTQRNLGLATEYEATHVFSDCKKGAFPPAGLLYDIDTMVDDSLLDQPDIYFEAGDHEQTVHMDRRNFGRLMGDATHARFSYPV